MKARKKESKKGKKGEVTKGCKEKIIIEIVANGK